MVDILPVSAQTPLSGRHGRTHLVNERAHDASVAERSGAAEALVRRFGNLGRFTSSIQGLPNEAIERIPGQIQYRGHTGDGG